MGRRKQDQRAITIRFPYGVYKRLQDASDEDNQSINGWVVNAVLTQLRVRDEIRAQREQLEKKATLELSRR